MGLGFFIPSGIMGIFGAFLIALAINGFKMPPGKALAMPGQLAWYLAWLGMLWLWFLWRYRTGIWAGLNWQLPGSWFRYFLLGPALGLCAGALGYLLDAQNIKMPMMEELLKDPVQRPLFIAFGVSLGPIVEEMFFRALVLPLAARQFGNVVALLLTSLPFAAIHGPQYEWSPAHLLILTLVSIAFGAIRLHSGSTGAAAVTHCAYNLFMFLGVSLNKV